MGGACSFVGRGGPGVGETRAPARPKKRNRGGGGAADENDEEMKLLIQPRDGIAPLIAAIKKARTSIELVIFRFDREDIERALHAAVGRGVQVHALIAHTNQGGAGRLRKLEQRLLGAGATVDRTGDDFIRYHGKFMIVDRTTLLVLGFNYTLLDITKSRSFGIVTKNRKTVQEADQAVRGRLREAPLRGDRIASGQPGKRARATVRVSQQGEDTAAHLRSEGQRPPDHQAAERARQGRRRRPDHRQGELARTIWSIRSIRGIGSTSAPLSAMAGTPSSAVKACAGSSWTSGAKWACSSRARRSSRN